MRLLTAVCPRVVHVPECRSQPPKKKEREQGRPPGSARTKRGVQSTAGLPCGPAEHSRPENTSRRQGAPRRAPVEDRGCPNRQRRHTSEGPCVRQEPLQRRWEGAQCANLSRQEGRMGKQLPTTARRDNCGRQSVRKALHVPHPGGPPCTLTMGELSHAPLQFEARWSTPARCTTEQCDGWPKACVRTYLS